MWDLSQRCRSDPVDFQRLCSAPAIGPGRNHDVRQVVGTTRQALRRWMEFCNGRNTLFPAQVPGFDSPLVQKWFYYSSYGCVSEARRSCGFKERARMQLKQWKFCAHRRGERGEVWRVQPKLSMRWLRARHLVGRWTIVNSREERARLAPSAAFSHALN